MADVSLLRDGAEPTQRVAARGGTIQSERADIVDRNGVVLATSVPVMSAFANPHLLLDPADAARKIVAALPEISSTTSSRRSSTATRASSGSSAASRRASTSWSIASASPASSSRPRSGASIRRATTGAHIVGYASIDNYGLAGIERYFDQRLQSGEAVQLSIDLRLQRMVEDELVQGGAEVLGDRRQPPS